MRSVQPWGRDRNRPLPFSHKGTLASIPFGRIRWRGQKRIVVFRGEVQPADVAGKRVPAAGRRQGVCCSMGLFLSGNGRRAWRCRLRGMHHRAPRQERHDQNRQKHMSNNPHAGTVTSQSQPVDDEVYTFARAPASKRGENRIPLRNLSGGECFSQDQGPCYQGMILLLEGFRCRSPCSTVVTSCP